jgi:hypothetical protein
MPDGVSVDSLQRFRLILDTPSMRELSVAEQRYQPTNVGNPFLVDAAQGSQQLANAVGEFVVISHSFPSPPLGRFNGADERPGDIAIDFGEDRHAVQSP